jgi:hypothetical protein
MKKIRVHPTFHISKCQEINYLQMSASTPRIFQGAGKHSKMILNDGKMMVK